PGQLPAGGGLPGVEPTLQRPGRGRDLLRDALHRRGRRAVIHGLPAPEGVVKLVTLNDLRLETGDTVVTAKGSFNVLERRGSDLHVVWLETARKDTMWVKDGVFGPVEVLRKGSGL